MPDGRYYYIANARRPDQRTKMVELEAAGICIFCPEHLGRFNGQPVLIETDHWSLVENDYPYAAALKHYLLVPRQHITTVQTLSVQAWIDFGIIHRMACAMIDLEGHAVWWRDGDPSVTGATIRHLHAHVAVADPVSDVPLVAYFSPLRTQ